MVSYGRGFRRRSLSLERRLEGRLGSLELRGLLEISKKGRGELPRAACAMLRPLESECPIRGRRACTGGCCGGCACGCSSPVALSHLHDRPEPLSPVRRQLCSRVDAESGEARSPCRPTTHSTDTTRVLHNTQANNTTANEKERCGARSRQHRSPIPPWSRPPRSSGRRRPRLGTGARWPCRTACSRARRCRRTHHRSRSTARHGTALHHSSTLGAPCVGLATLTLPVLAPPRPRPARPMLPGPTGPPKPPPKAASIGPIVSSIVAASRNCFLNFETARYASCRETFPSPLASTRLRSAARLWEMAAPSMAEESEGTGKDASRIAVTCGGAKPSCGWAHLAASARGLASAHPRRCAARTLPSPGCASAAACSSGEIESSASSSIASKTSRASSLSDCFSRSCA